MLEHIFPSPIRACVLEDPAATIPRHPDSGDWLCSSCVVQAALAVHRTLPSSIRRWPCILTFHGSCSCLKRFIGTGAPKLVLVTFARALMLLFTCLGRGDAAISKHPANWKFRSVGTHLKYLLGFVIHALPGLWFAVQLNIIVG